MPKCFALLIILSSGWLACGHPISSQDCERLLARYTACQIPVALSVNACAKRFGALGTSCQKSFDHYVRCIEQTDCTTLADPNAVAICKNEFISLDIDCDGADFSGE